MKNINYKKLISISLVILLGIQLFFPFGSLVHAAMIPDPPPSSVDGTVPITVSPALDGETIWYFDSLIDVKKNTGELIGRAYQYRSQNGVYRTLVNPGYEGYWITAFGGETSYAISRQFWYGFQPDFGKQGFNRVKISDLIIDSGATYVNRGSYIEVTPTSRPRIKTFSPKPASQPSTNGCYRLNDELSIDIGIEEYVPTTNALKVQVYSYDTTHNEVYNQFVQANSSGQWTTTIKVPLKTLGKTKFGIRVFDGIDRLDIDTHTNPIQLGVNDVGKTFEICVDPVLQQDAESLPLFDYTDNTYLVSRDLMQTGPLVRSNNSLKSHPNGTTQYFGPKRYPTLYRGKPSDGGQPTNKNQTFEVDGKVGPAWIRAYDFPFLYLVGPVKDNVPYGGKIHDYIETTGFNVQQVEMFNATKINEMFNGNGQWVYDIAAPKHTIINRKTLKIYGTYYYYIRDLAYYSGGEADNADIGNNDTNLQIYQTDYPDISKFEEKPGNTHKVGDKLYLDFNGYEYVSENRTKVSWVIEIVSGPNTGGKINGNGSLNLKSSKGMKNPEKPYMNSYVGKYQAGTTYFTPSQAGTYVLELRVTDEVQRMTKKQITVTVTGDGDGGENPPPESGDCTVVISPPSAGTKNTANQMDPNTSGVIKADSRGAERFDVLQGIPTSETLYTNAFAKEYLFKNTFTQMNGEVNFTVQVTKTYNLTWKIPRQVCTPTEGGGQSCTTVYDPQSATETVTKPYTVKRPYSYWQIDNLEVYGLSQAMMANYALPSGSVTMTPSGYTPPSVDAVNSDDVNEHVKPAACSNVNLGSQSIDGGTSRPSVPSENWQSQAEGAVGQNQAKNDKVIFKGSTIMSDAWTNINGPTPLPIPESSLTHRDVFYRTGLMISNSLVNRLNTTSSGSVTYSLIKGIKGGISSQSYPINGINTVTVHTPVVIYARMSDDKEHDQRTNPPSRSTPANPNTDRHALILDRFFTITMATDGQHRNIPGYGYRDYSKYIKSKQVKFPFDVYSESKSTFYPANTWIDVAVQEINKTFFLPVWVPEGQYTAEFQVFAINAPSSNYGTEQEANITIPNSAWNIPPAGYQSAAHSATDTIATDVVGRLYDFRVTDISDFNWESVFRTTVGLPGHTGKVYWVGTKGIDGALRGNSEPFVLPIRHGSHPEGYKNLAVKQGYKFRFDMKSKGDMWRENDAVRITPSFYFVDKNGLNRRKVDVYYHDDSNYFVKVGSSQDKEYREVVLNEPFRNVPIAQVQNTADFYYRHPDHYGFRDSVNELFEHSFIRKYEKEFSKEPTQTGPYGWQILNWKLRTLIGPLANQVPSNAMVPQKDAIKSEQTWYGEYSLPSKLYIVEEGTNIAGYGITHRINEQSPVFLHDGFLIANFNIESIQNGNVNQPHLQYIHGKLSNQWKREGFKYQFTDPYGFTFSLMDGDVIFYHGDKSSKGDFSPGVTH